ncbi:DUF6114 domain-containing protein [Luteimicrobium subarcticum]|uniref:Uncharacterized protein n=1 Tax=Luteimicrobium subarcticum TaxID=620910 RepID=A0A2M8WSW3_9MICO|nr:DUF6114 domain-containing protein [Luteimicrobium subarcticum]PJI94041.1 hypothetical protein CLV34_1525 [Luteimicrobium subarcticum]
MSSTPETTTPADEAQPQPEARPGTVARTWTAFRAWTRGRPFVGGLLVVLAGVEMFFSGQLDLGHIHLQFGIQGFQAMVIPVVLVLLGVLLWTMPVHRVFYGVIALVLSVYSLIGVNLGGFFIGMLLGMAGGIVAVSWLPRTAATTPDAPADDASDASDPDRRPTTRRAPSGRTAPDDDYSLVPGFEPEDSPAPVPAASPATLTLHTVETAGDDTASGPRPFLPASADPDATPSTSPAATPAPADAPSSAPSSAPGATSRRGRRLTRATGAAVVAVCAAAGVGAVNAAQAPPADASAEASIPVPTFLQWLVPGSAGGSAEEPAPTGGPTAAQTATGDRTDTPATATPTPTESSSTTPSTTPGTDVTTAPGTAPSTGSGGTTSPTTEPTGTASPTATSPLPDPTTAAPRLTSTSADPVAPVAISHLEGSTLQLTNSVYQGNVTLRRADGTTVEVMKFTADKSVIDDFSLDVPNGDGHGLLTTSSKVTNTGHVVLYATRLEGYLLGFKFTFKPETPPPGVIPLPSLSDPRMELVATTSDRSTWANTHQKLY